MRSSALSRLTWRALSSRASIWPGWPALVLGVTALVLLGFLASAQAHAEGAAELNYRFYCAQCHGITGAGDGPNATRYQPVEPRNFTSWSEMSILTDSEIILAIEHGGTATAKSTLMPPFVETLTGAEIVELKDYIRMLCRCVGPESPRSP